MDKVQKAIQIIKEVGSLQFGEPVKGFRYAEGKEAKFAIGINYNYGGNVALSVKYPPDRQFTTIAIFMRIGN